MKNIWRFFLVIFLFITLFFVVLTNGIRIENLTLPKVKISQLYIKLDKKLIVSIDTIDIDTKSKNDSSLNEIHSLTKNLPYLYGFFKYISIQNIIYDNKKIHFLYKDEVFYIDSNFVSLDARLKDWSDSIEVHIEQITLKDFQIKLKGKLQANFKENIYDFRGNFTTFNINGGIELRAENSMLYYRLNTQKFKTLKPFMDFLSKKTDMEPLISAWIYKKIIADEYQLHNLEGQFNLNTLDFYPNLMKGKASAKNAVVKFDENAPSALVNDLDVILKNDQLIFDVKKAEYQAKDVTNTKVYIYNLMTKGAGIVVDINAHTILDDSIHAILHAFDIKVPITQTAGKTEANVKLDIGFLPIEVKSYTGYFKINDANISLNGVPMYSKSGYVKLDNGIIELQNTNLKYDTLFDIYTSGDLNLTNGIYNSKNKIDSLNVNFDSINLLHVEDFNSSATMKIDTNGTSIYIDKLKTNLEFLTNNNKIIIEDLSLIYPYSKLMKNVDIKAGKLKIDTKDFRHYQIAAKLKEMNLPLEYYENQITKMDLNITTDGKNLEIISKDKNLQIKKKDDIKILIKNTDVTFDSSKDKSSMDIGKISIEGINSNIRDINSTLKIPSNHYVYESDGKKISFTSNLFKQSIYVEQSDKNLYVVSKNLTDLFVNTILDKQVFENGSFELHIDGKNTKNFDGTFIATNTTIKGMTFYNNLMAFMNTIPSLVTFKNPGFNDEGYAMNRALLEFQRIGNILVINEIKINGESADITGKGYVDIQTGLINIELQISVLKNFSSLVNSIPVVNYIFLGKNGKMYTSVKVSGTLEKPKMQTNIIQDTVLSPVGIIKRTIETPFRIFQ
jgi:hypothetical protein